LSAVTDTIRNGVDTEQMFATLDLIKAQPELARSRLGWQLRVARGRRAARIRGARRLPGRRSPALPGAQSRRGPGSRAASLGIAEYQERVGDYVYAAASRTYGTGVWSDLRRAAVCNAVQDYRARSLAAGQLALPAPWPPGDCPATFGNVDIWAATTG
jgi:hypothetical protein